MFYLVPISFQYRAEWKHGHNECVGNCTIKYCRVLSITSPWQQHFVTGALMKVLIGATSCADQILCLSFKALQIWASFFAKLLKQVVYNRFVRHLYVCKGLKSEDRLSREGTFLVIQLLKKEKTPRGFCLFSFSFFFSFQRNKQSLKYCNFLYSSV